MVRAWMMDENTVVDQRQPHQRDPNVPVDLAEVAKLGVLYYKIEGDDFDNNEMLQKIRKDRGYSYEDCITCSQEKLPNYEEKIKMFFEEHLHSDEEIRLCTEGSGFFDVRNKQDQWIRIEMEKGDLIILPAGIFHRFTLDAKNYITARRYFVGEPVWTPINRCSEKIDENPVRKQYVSTLESA